MSLASLSIHRCFNEVKRGGIITDHKPHQSLLKVHSSSVKNSTEVRMGDRDREQVLLKFGLLSDIQHTPVPAEGFSFHGNPRYYLDSLVKARHAVTDFIECEVDMAIHLGDIVDYHAKKHGESEAALDAILECFDGLDGRPVLHCIGNHCLYNAPRHVLNEKLGIREKVQSSGNGVVGKHSYFSFKPKMRAPESVQYNFIVLDGYDVSLLGWEPGHPHHEKAREILDSINPNCDQNSNFGLEGLDKRFVKFGGGVSEEQLEWLEKELEGSRLAGEKCIVCCHLCMHPMTCPETCLLYNYDQVLSKLDKYKGTVVATLAGHAHRGGYFFDQETGIHHRVCEAVLETPPGDQCHAVVSIFDDRIEIQGRGAFDTDTWMLGDGN